MLLDDLFFKFNYIVWFLVTVRPGGPSILKNCLKRSLRHCLAAQKVHNLKPSIQTNIEEAIKRLKNNQVPASEMLKETLMESGRAAQTYYLTHLKSPKVPKNKNKTSTKYNTSESWRQRSAENMLAFDMATRFEDLDIANDLYQM